MNPTDDGWCLVLSGGGAKGVFHIGAWRALKELGLPVRAFVGNSIGAVMAGFLAAGREAELETLGRSITVDTLLELPQKAASLRQLWRYFVDNGGLDTGPMRRLLDAHIDEAALRAAKVDLGVVTVNVTDLKPQPMFLDEMPQGSLIDYLMASSAFPGFALPRINGKHYVDGGLWDNLPYDLARSRGWRRIILIDVSGIGWNRRPELAGGVTAYVKASIEMGGPFDFDRTFLTNFEQLGYLDTLRTFGRLVGQYTYLEPNDDLERAHHEQTSGSGIRDRYRLATLLDHAAAALEVERIRRWSYHELADELVRRRAEEDRLVAETLAGTGRLPKDPRRQPLLAAVSAAIQGGALGTSPYRTLQLVRQLSTGRTRTMLEKMLRTLHPGLPLADAYFELAPPLVSE